MDGQVIVDQGSHHRAQQGHLDGEPQDQLRPRAAVLAQARIGPHPGHWLEPGLGRAHSSGQGICMDTCDVSAVSGAHRRLKARCSLRIPEPSRKGLSLSLHIPIY